MELIRKKFTFYLTFSFDPITFCIIINIVIDTLDMLLMTYTSNDAIC